MRHCQNTQLSVERLEDRCLLSTGIFFNPIKGQIRILGTSRADSAEVSINSDSKVVVTLDSEAKGGGNPVHHEAVFDDVRQIVFYGRRGNDIFSNRTSIGSLAFGGRGDDLLTGGLGSSVLKGGYGSDELVGGPDDDVFAGGRHTDTFILNGGTDKIIGRNVRDIVLDNSAGDFRTLAIALFDVLGKATGTPIVLESDNIEYQQFEQGIIVGPIGQPAIPLFGDLYERWLELGGFDGPFSYPVSARASFTNGAVIQDFKYGWMASHPSTGILAVSSNPGEYATSSADLPLLLSPASNFEPGLSLLGWTPIADDIAGFGEDIADWVQPDTEYTDLRTPSGGGGTTKQTVLPPVLPDPFHYDPSLIIITPSKVKYSWQVFQQTANGTVLNFEFYGSTRKGETSYWSDIPGAVNAVYSQVESRLDDMVPSVGIRRDPLFGSPIRVVLVDTIFDLKTNKALPDKGGFNKLWTYWETNDGLTEYKAARLIQLKKWYDEDEGDSMVNTFIHEIGHSWNSVGLSDIVRGGATTPWMSTHTAVFNSFLGLSGWATTNAGKSWTPTAGRAGFVSDYAMTHPSEDWAETFEYASRPGLSLAGLNAVLRSKVELILDFLRDVIPTSAELGIITSEHISTPAPNT